MPARAIVPATCCSTSMVTSANWGVEALSVMLPKAVAEARKARIEIMDEDALDQLWLEIMDEGGRVVAKID
jgi:hypothetical protein